jgi:hypothetical protein
MRDAMTTYQAGLSVALISILAAGCTDVYRQSGTPLPGYGNSVRQNAAVMIVDPQPVSAANTQIDFDGRKAGIAIERYRRGEVIPPVELRTTDVLQ